MTGLICPRCTSTLTVNQTDYDRYHVCPSCGWRSNIGIRKASFIRPVPASIPKPVVNPIAAENAARARYMARTGHKRALLPGGEADVGVLLCTCHDCASSTDTLPYHAKPYTYPVWLCPDCAAYREAHAAAWVFELRTGGSVGPVQIRRESRVG